MTAEWVSKVKQTKRLELSIWQTALLYLIVLVPLMYPIIQLYHVVQYYLLHIVDGYDGFTISSGVWILVSLFITAVVFLKRRQNVRFKEVYLKHDMEQFKKALEITKRQLDWHIKRSNQTYTIASSDDNIGNGNNNNERTITIIRTENGILINSFTGNGFIDFMGWGKIDERFFIHNLEEAVSGAKETLPEEFAPSSERKFSKALLRVFFFYPVCLITITLGIFVIVMGGLQGIFLGLSLIAIIVYCIKVDLQALNASKPKE